MKKTKRVIVTTIPVRLTQPEHDQLIRVRTILGSTSDAKAFREALNELDYLQRENKRLENLIQKLQNEYYTTEEETGQESRKENILEGEGLQTTAGISDEPGRKEYTGNSEAHGD